MKNLSFMKLEKREKRALVVLVEGKRRCFVFLKVRFSPTECLEGRLERRFPSDFRFPVFCFDVFTSCVFCAFDISYVFL